MLRMPEKSLSGIEISSGSQRPQSGIGIFRHQGQSGTAGQEFRPELPNYGRW
jgi:hypothetical protein